MVVALAGRRRQLSAATVNAAAAPVSSQLVCWTNVPALAFPASAANAATTTRPLRYFVDWTEQAHHLAGPLGTAITGRLLELEWITRGAVPRSIRVTPDGERGLKELLAITSRFRVEGRETPRARSG